MLIDSFEKFCALPTAQLRQVTELHLRDFWDAEQAQDLFLAQLRKAKKLRVLNLADTYTPSADHLIRIANALRQDARAPLEHVNLYRIDGDVSQAVLDAFAGPNTLVLHDSIPTPEVALPTGWVFNGRNLLVPEALQLFKSAEAMIFDARRKKRKLPEKFHPYFNSKSNKRNKAALNSATDVQTSFDQAVLVTRNGSLILPKYRQMPEKVYFIGARSNQDRRGKLAIAKRGEALDLKFLKIGISKEKSPLLQAHLDAGFRLCENFEYFSRPYRLKDGRTFVKEYFIADYLGEKDVLDHLPYLENHPDGLLLKKRATIALLLELICIHNMGLWHRDFKPENCMFIGPDEVKAIDFDCSIPAIPGQLIDNPSTFGTPDYLPPEIKTVLLSKRAKENTAAIDYYSCGLAICGIFYGDLFADGNTNLISALNYIGNYVSVELADLLAELTATNPERRSSIQATFAELQKILPDLFAAPLQIKRERILDRLRADRIKFPETMQIIEHIIQSLPAVDNFKAYVNSIFRLQLVNYYLHIFRLPGKVTRANMQLFADAIAALYALPDKDIRDCTALYYNNAPIEEQIKALRAKAEKPRARPAARLLD